MYRDNSLVPIETVRIAALGALATKPRTYGEIAADVRLFTSRIVGPSLDLMGISIELLRAEGVVETLPEDADQKDPRLTLTPDGHEMLLRLLQAPIRSPNTELSRLVVALKMRFLHLLAPAARQAQVAMLRALTVAERQRFCELEEQSDGANLFKDWLALQIQLLDTRLAWLDGFSKRCGS
jgi:DNA-binding PadR family transcriptional regulator